MSGTDVLVSVVLPVHNGERFLADTVRSVLEQSLAELELVVVDDGSTDGSVRIAESFADPRVRVVSTKRGGVAAALNTGLQVARGEFVARIDADDIMESDRLEKQVAFLRGNPAIGGAASYYTIIDENGLVLGSMDVPLLTPDDVRLYLNSGAHLIYAHPTVMVRRDLVLALGGYDAAYEQCEDVELFLRMYEAGSPLVIQPERLTRFRYHRMSVSARNGYGQILLNEVIFGNFRRRQKALEPLALDAYAARLLSSPAWRLRLRLKAEMAQSRRRRLHGSRLGNTALYLALMALNGLLDPVGDVRRVWVAVILRAKARRRLSSLA